MKRFFTILFTVLLLTAALCVTASASDFDAVAEDLSAIGMFRGTANGFELDRAPTRSEAAIMLVRLYGAEEAAKTAYEAGEISHPFTDVSEFTSPYVAWLYTNSITNGFTETTYASQRACTAQNYVAFLLRALGYKDGTDFQYADALTFAQEKGFYDSLAFSGTFLRDDLAALTYQGLAADMADGKTYLLDSLIKSKAIDKTAAKPMTDKIEAYRAMQSACADMDSTMLDADIDMKMDMTMSVAGETMTMPTEMTGNMKMIADNLSNVQLAYELNTSLEGAETTMGMWMKDGWQYLSMTVAGETTKIKSPVDDVTTALESLPVVDVDSMNVSGLAMIGSITSKTVSNGTEYTMVFSENLGGSMDAVNELLGEAGTEASMDISEIKAVYTVDRSGNLKKMTMVFSASMTMDMPLEDGSVVSMDLIYDYDLTMTIKATGSRVKITWPDFSDFQEVSAEEFDSVA